MKQLRTLCTLFVFLFLIEEASAQASSNFVFTNINTTSFTVSWTNGAGPGRLVSVSTSAAVSYPVDFTNYIASTTFGAGSNLGNSNYVAYKGTGSAVTITGLTTGTYYYIRVFEYTGTSTSPNFTTSPYGSTGHYTLVAQPTTQASGLSVSAITTSGATLSWTSGSGTYELAAVRASTTNTITPTDGNDYASSSAYGSGAALGTSSPYSYVVYDGSGSSVPVSNLNPGTSYVANVFNYDGTAGRNNYITSGYPTVGFNTLSSEPTSYVSNLEAKDEEDDAMTISWCNANSGGGTYHLVLMNSNSSYDVPVDANLYNANSSYGNGSLIGSSYVVYAGTGNGVRVTNLNMETSYTIRVFDYNGANGTFNPTTNYLTSAPTIYQETNTTHPIVGSSSMNFTSVTPTSLTVNWTSGTGQYRVVTCKPNRRPTALAFDGTNDHVVVPYHASLQPSTAVTLEAWVYRPSWSASTGSQVIAGNGETGGYYLMQSGTWMYYSVYRNGAWGQAYANVAHLTPGWHHFALTYDGRYLNGMIDGSVYDINDAGGTYPITYTYSNAFIIGADVGTGATASGSYFNGQIDEVRVWNDNIYYWNVEYYRWTGVYGNESDLVGCWRFDDGMTSTTTATNSAVTVNNLNGTLTNMTSTAASSATPSSGWAWSLSPINQPQDFAYYSGSTILGNGNMVGNNTYAITNTTGSSVTVTGLSPGTYYTFTVTEYDEDGSPYYNYDTPRMLVGETTTSSSPVPVITNMSPVSGSVGTLVTLTGTGFSTTVNDNYVYFGPTRATVSSATANQLQVVVPYGTNNTPVSVQVNGLTGTYTREFNVTSSCSNPINTGSFAASTQTTSNLSYGNVVKDWTGDGKTDILVANASTTAINSFAGQSVNGASPPTFSVSTTSVGTNPYFVKSADMDGDGKNDLIVSQGTSGYVSVYRGMNSYFNSTARCDLPTNGTPLQIDVADFDGDGKLDIVCGYSGMSQISVFRNTSSNLTLSFAPRTDIVTAANMLAVAARDMDGDNKADIVFGHSSGTTFSVLRSTGTPGNISFATVQNFSTGAGSVYGITFGDFNSDGKPDIVCALSNNFVRFYQNTSTVGSINYSYQTQMATLASAPYALVANDFDGDGRHDLAVAYASGGSVSIFEATNNFSFAARVDFAVPGTSPSLSSGDFNQDGKPDLVGSTYTNSINILTNVMDPLAGEPTTPASSLIVSGQTQTSMTLNFTAGNGFNRIVTCRQGSPIVNTPFDGAGYAANPIFGSGANLGGGTYCVYNGTGNSVTVTGLTSNTVYYFAVYEYNSNGSGCTNDYLLTSGATSASTLNTPPTINAIANPSAICQNSSLQTVNFSGVGTGSVGETQTLTVTASSSNPALIPTPSVTYSSPNATGSLSYTPAVGQYGTSVITVTVNDNAANNNTTTTTFTVTVSQQPSTANAGPDQNICIGTATLAANTPAVGTGQWSVFATNDPSITNGNISNINSPNTTLNGLTTGDIVTLRWTISNGSCTPSTDNVIITMGSCPLTAQFTWAPASICATAAQINNISFTDQSYAPSTTIQTWNWTFSGPTTPNPSSSTQQNPSNIQFTGPGSFTVTLTITDNAAGNSNITHTINILPYPAAAGAVTGSATVCQGASLVPYSVPAIANATTYNWTLPSGAVIASGAGTNSILVDYGLAATSGFVQVQGQNSCGVGTASSPFNVTVNPVPGATSSITGPLSVCQGQTGVTFSTTGIPFATTYNWTLPPGATITSSPTASTITVDFAPNASGGVIDVIGVNSCGSGSSSVGITISMNPLPDAAGTISGPVQVCEGTTGVVYSVASILNTTTYNWTLPPGVVITSGSGTNAITCDFTNATGSGNVTVTGTNSCGSGTTSQLAVTVGLLPDSSTAITGPTTVCAGSTGVQYSITAISGAASYNWTLPAGATIVMDNGNAITVDFSPVAQSGPVSVYGVNQCGNGVAGPGISVTVDPLPDTTLLVSGPATVCEGDTAAVFTIGSVANATGYAWTLPAGVVITSGDSTSSITVSITGAAMNGQIYVSGTNACGTGVASDTLALTVNPLPDAAGVISGPGNIAICPAATGITFTVPAVNNAAYYTWSLPPGATIVAGDSTGTITVDFTSAASSGAVSVAGMNGCGSSDTAFLNFAVDVVTPVDICMVTVDGPSQYNNVMWDKPAATDIDSFRVYREITSNNYQVVGTVSYDSLSLFIDSVYVPFADPNATFQRYKISAIDSCGNESPLSNHHRTLFMQASVGTSGEANLSWSLYEGQSVDYYRILRDSTLTGNWEVIDSVPGTNWVYTDWSPPITVSQCRYRVQTVWQVSCNPTRTIITSESNLEDLIVNGVNDHNASFPVQMFPNPTNSVVTIVTPASTDGVTYEVMDATGRIVMVKKENNGANGRQVTQLDLSGLADGAYTIVITAGDVKQHEKVILQK